MNLDVITKPSESVYVEPEIATRLMQAAVMINTIRGQGRMHVHQAEANIVIELLPDPNTPPNVI